MSRKDYIRIADAIREVTAPSAQKDGWDAKRWRQALIERMAETLAEDNPRFNYGRFADYIERR